MTSAANVGHEIRFRRNGVGLSQGALAARLGVSQAAVSNWESGLRQPTIEDLYAIARELKCEITDLLPRQRPAIRAALRAVADSLDLSSLGAEAEAFLDAADLVNAPQAHFTTRARRAADAADDLLRRAGARTAPIDVRAIAVGCGIRVLEWPFTSRDLSGLVVETAQGPVIGVQKGDANVRQRFSIAHELGHVVLRHLDSFHVDLGAGAEHGDPPGYNWRHERDANDFAANILMPSDLVRDAAASCDSAHALAISFQVSELAMGFRLVNLGLR